MISNDSTRAAWARRRAALVVIGALMTTGAGCASDPSSDDDADATPSEDTTAPTDTASGTDTSSLDVVETCTLTSEGAPCDDGDPCTVDDECAGGLCVGGASRACEDPSPCRTGRCEPGEGCVFEDVADGEACALPCFTAATCDAGVCVPDEGSAKSCPSAADPCVDRWSCDPTTGECTVPIFALEGATCDLDEDVCTLDACDGEGACVTTGAVQTCATQSANNPCWTYSCVKKTGCVRTTFVTGASCDDLNACTGNDSCVVNDQGQQGCLGEPLRIDDGNPCTNDACAAGTITHTPVDGVVCDVPDDLCVGTGLCAEGNCVAAPVVDCDDDDPCTDDACDPATGACTHQPGSEGESCDDGDSCTTGETCTSGVCQGGGVVPGCCGNGLCEDGELCGCADCEGEACDDGDVCVTGETCQPDGSCGGGTTLAVCCGDGVCAPEERCGCVADCDGESCDDGDDCTEGDVCTASGACLGAAKSCGDDDDCTADSCQGGACVNTPVCGPPGTLDPTFAEDGVALTTLARDAWMGAIHVDAAGRVVVTGELRFPAVHVAVRYTSDGSLDDSFGSGGVVQTNIGASNDAGLGSALLADGRIILSGHVAHNTAGLVALNGDGSLDTTFAASGVLASVKTEPTVWYDVVSDGSALFAAGAWNDDFVVQRVGLDGALTSAAWAHDFDAHDTLVRAALDDQGRLVAAGSTSGTATLFRIAVTRFDADGLDTSFGTDGTTTLGSGVSTNWLATDMALQSDGSVVVVGSRFGAESGAVFARLTPNGALDTSFGTGGFVDTGLKRALGVAGQPDDAIVVVGEHRPATSLDLAVARFGADGAPDTAFGTGGLASFDFGGNSDRAAAAAFTTDDRIVVVGESAGRVVVLRLWR